MYCPICKSEYRDGYDRCEECNTDLVENVTDEGVREEKAYIEILPSVQKENIGLIRSILDAEQIDYQIFDESFGNLYPVPGTNRVYVSKFDFEAATDLLKEFI